MASKKILLHICCGVCAGETARKLMEEGFDVTGFFYNPNIEPADEREKRFEAAAAAARILGFKLLRDDTGVDEWKKISAGLEGEPEGGKRCELCFRMRLEKSWEKAQEDGIPLFTTTLTISPHKNAAAVNNIGKTVNQAGFLERDFKKAGGFAKAMEFAKKNGIYRQNYCGCAHGKKQGRQNEGS